MALAREGNNRVSALEGRDEPDPGAETTVKNMAGLLGLSQTTIRRRIASGRIRARRVGGRVLVAK